MVVVVGASASIGAVADVACSQLPPFALRALAVPVGFFASCFCPRAAHIDSDGLFPAVVTAVAHFGREEFGAGADRREEEFLVSVAQAAMIPAVVPVTAA